MSDTHAANSADEEDRQQASCPPLITDSLSSVQPPSPSQSAHTLPENKDDSLWHEKSCRPVILALIQGRTLVEVQSLIDSGQLLKDALLQQLKLRQAGESDKGLGFLNLKVEAYHKRDPICDESTAVEIFDSWSPATGLRRFHLSRTSINSATSQSSTNSVASQVSDSNLNDFEQSAEIFLQDLDQGIRALQLIERDTFWSKLQLKSISLTGEAKELHDAIDRAMNQLRMARGDMETIGFSDVGLRLNICGEHYSHNVLRFLETARDHKGSFGKLRKSLGLSKTAKSVRDGYPRLTKTVQGTMDTVNHKLQCGVALRDRLLSCSYEVIKEVVYEFAEKNGIEIRDVFRGSVLIQREFKKPDQQLDLLDV